MNNIIGIAVTAAQEAGTFLADNFGKVKSFQRKADNSLVSDIDKKSEEIIVGYIKNAFPEHGIIAEESGESVGNAEYIWIIDPLDGTHNYLRSIPQFGVSIGVMSKNDFYAGAIYLPMEDEFYTAIKGEGAFKNGKKILVSGVDKISDATVSFDSTLRDNSDQKLSVLRKTVSSVFNIRMFGTSVRILTYLAEGKIDSIIEFDDKPWDYAGGACLVREAGGKITCRDGQPLSGSDLGYAASNGLIHDELLDLMKG